MKIQINHKIKRDKHIDYLLLHLPEKIKIYLEKYIADNLLIKIDEIRLHGGAYMCLITSLRTIKTDLFITEDDIEDTALTLCSGSIYSHFDTIKEGYISLGKGIRVGICGKATLQNGQITAISDFSSLNIRLPKRVYHGADYLFDLIKEDSFKSSVILYSPPGIGKTTILRELIYKLSSLEDPIRFSVIDSREEIIAGLEIDSPLDVFLSYPKGIAITLATRTMTPELIICDEISTIDEANAILTSVNCGISIIATTHASSFQELKSKKQLSSLIDKGIFDYALGVSRDVGSTKYIFTLDSLKECYV